MAVQPFLHILNLSVKLLSGLPGLASLLLPKQRELARASLDGRMFDENRSV